ncbi:uncharacterized protein IWZ02DRAFT_116141 [Phyllosticta citriasiana]|uniref:uncharacterized protein n=1 Tax=Phyllosticta citriasiana TaxID=595635 RepID=UPI0030FD2E4A
MGRPTSWHHFGMLGCSATFSRQCGRRAGGWFALVSGNIDRLLGAIVPKVRFSMPFKSWNYAPQVLSDYTHGVAKASSVCCCIRPKVSGNIKTSPKEAACGIMSSRVRLGNSSGYLSGSKRQMCQERRFVVMSTRYRRLGSLCRKNIGLARRVKDLHGDPHRDEMRIKSPRGP